MSAKSKKKSSADFRVWFNRVESAENIQKKHKADWDKYQKAYHGDILDKSTSDYSANYNVPNLFYMDVRSSIPKLYTQNPYIFVEPETPEADLNAEILEKVINIQMDKRWFFKRVMRDLVKGTKIKGRSYLKVSYKYDQDRVGREFAGEELNDEIIISFVDRASLIIDPNATSFHSARWVAHKIREKVGVIRSKFKIPKDTKITVEEDCKEYNDNNNLSNDEREDFLYGYYYEVEDRENRKLFHIVHGLDDWVDEPRDFPYRFYSLYSALEWNDVPNELNTRSDLHFWIALLEQLAEVKTQQANHRRKLNSKYIKTGGAKLTDEQIEDLTTYEDATVVELSAGQNISTLNHATLGQEVYSYEQSLRQDCMIVSGMNEMKQGLPQASKTAREAMAIVEEAQNVLSDRASRVEEVVKEVIEKCIILIQDFYDTTKIIRLTGMEEVEYLGLKDRYQDRLEGNSKKPFLRFVGKDLVGKMEVRVKPGSSQPASEEQREQSLTKLIGLIGQLPTLNAAIDPVEVLKEIARVLHIENKGIILDTSTPEQENSILKRDVPVMPKINEPHDIHIAAHERENNGTNAFILHILGHKLMKSFKDSAEKAAPQKAMPAQQAPDGDLSQENISGFPQGSSVPPEMLPEQQSQQQTNQQIPPVNIQG